MPRAQCYYEILQVPETCGQDEIKKAYRSLALKWHPDKNQDDPVAAHAKFQSILKAYETLSDNREREWYDRHKDQILSYGEKGDADQCLNLFQYFSSSCYANFDDNDTGFYTVYRKVFETIKEEELKALKQLSKLSSRSKSNRNDDEADSLFPDFGDSKSSYDEVVRDFYAYWSGFCTSITFDHLDKYNITEAENRRILRAMEKENKKIKEAARKERNTNVRSLVEFVKKRDKRLKAHKLLLEQQNQMNRQKTAAKQRKQREKTLQESSEYKPGSWQDMSDIEERLQELESELDREEKKFYKDRGCVIDEDSDELDQDNSNEIKDDETNDLECDEQEDPEEKFICQACNKDFTSLNALKNHEASKKHKQKLAKIAKMLEEEG